MPRAELPTTPIGWVVAVAAALVGLISGFLTVRILGGMV